MKHMVYAICLMLASALPALAEQVPGAAQALNAFRAKSGLGAVVLSPALQAAAEDHAKDMAARKFFGHKGSDGSSVGKRVERRGYQYRVIAENVAYGQKSLNDVMVAWIKSPGHRKNMQVGNIKEMGLARVGIYWVMVLGAQK